MYCSVASIGHADMMWSVVSSNCCNFIVGIQFGFQYHS
jgi:hypothetical protein